MTFSMRATTLLTLAVILMVGALSLVSVWLADTLTGSFHQQNFGLIQKVVESQLRNAEKNALSAAETIIAAPSVRDAFIAKERAQLLDLTREQFGLLKEKYRVNQGQFHSPPASSFLRLHRPEKFGDDLSSIRSMVVDVNKSSTVRSGTEITSSGIAIFGTIPVKDDAGQSVGSFEIGYEIGGVMDEMKRSYGFDSDVFIDEALLKSKATSLTGEVFNDENRVGKYVRFFSTNRELGAQLVTDQAINVREPQHHMGEIAGNSFGILLLPFYDYSKTQIGVVVIMADMDQVEAEGKRAIVWQASLGVMAVLLLVGVILVVVRGLILKPIVHLDSHIKSLVDHDEHDPVDAELWCEEMRALASSCDNLARTVSARRGGVSS
jgi:methyl-accepting chemotaxis protein